VADMRSRKSPGTILNVISMSMHGGQPYLAPYVASKAGLAGLTKNAAFAHRFDRIRINGLNIGWTATPGEAVTQQTFHDADSTWLERAEAAQPMGKLGPRRSPTRSSSCSARAAVWSPGRSSTGIRTCPAPTTSNDQ
jgi:NAD(P)-dependent dehydrogenase (short-subunit alcohol dehydrogenase family)